MRLACLEFTTRGSSSINVGDLCRGSFPGCSLFGFFLLIPLQFTPSACPRQVPSHLPSALKGTAVHPWMNHRGFPARFSVNSRERHKIRVLLIFPRLEDGALITPSI